MTGLSRNTIAKWLKAPLVCEPKYRRRERLGKLTAVHESLKQVLKADAHRPRHERRAARALYNEIKAAGYEGGYPSRSRWTSPRPRPVTSGRTSVFALDSPCGGSSQPVLPAFRECRHLRLMWWLTASARPDCCPTVPKLSQILKRARKKHLASLLSA